MKHELKGIIDHTAGDEKGSQVGFETGNMHVTDTLEGGVGGGAIFLYMQWNESSWDACIGLKRGGINNPLGGRGISLTRKDFPLSGPLGVGCLGRAEETWTETLYHLFFTPGSSGGQSKTQGCCFIRTSSSGY